jgi:predicted ribosomally synthesized peptide with SipW-like signal peptide
MKKILGLTVAALLVIGLVVGGTWAYFSDPETAAGNTISAGTLDLSVNGENPLTTTFALTGADDVYPGGSGIIEWDLDNAGDMDGYLDISFSDIVDTENTVQEPETGDDDTSGELAEALHLEIFIDENGNNSYDAGETLIHDDYVTGGTTELTASACDDYQLNDDDPVRQFIISWSLDGATVGNNIMSDIAGFDIAFSLEQQAD